jgi:hypothetical protein
MTAKQKADAEKEELLGGGGENAITARNYSTKDFGY